MTQEIIKAKFKETEFPLTTPNIFGGILTPASGDKGDGLVSLTMEDERISKYSKPVVSACEGHETWTHLGAATVKVLNVVPQEGEVTIIMEIKGGPIDYRTHVLIY